MRKIFAIAALGFLTLSVPAIAAESHLDDAIPANGSGGVRVDCPGTIVWDTGMFDEFTPPAGCSTAGSAGCFIGAINDGGFPVDGRRMADDFIAITTDPITGIKTWARYNASGYDYHINGPGGLHGFCVKFYLAQPGPWCPDGTVAGETAIGSIVYDEYTQNFVEEEVFTGLIRNFNYCITLDVPFYPVQDEVYWVSMSADFDFTTWGSGVTQWFNRMYSGLGISFCEASWWDTWNTPNTNWNAISQAINIPCWNGWDIGFVLYSGDVQIPEGACCYADGSCLVQTRVDCDAAGGAYQGDGTVCDPNPCPPPVATESATWGSIRAQFR